MEWKFDWTQDPLVLSNQYEKCQFDRRFFKIIAKPVIEILSPQRVPEPHNLIYDDELVYSKLLAPLERFIFNLKDDAPEEEIDEVRNHLKTLKRPTRLCRKFLKTGAVLFSCNDCGFDNTCVLCIDCFHRSAHKDHNYRMSNTDGGGCCDCGDVEAWKAYPACSAHEAPDQPSLKISDYEDKEKRAKQLERDKIASLDSIASLPAGMAERFFLISQASLYYAQRMLLWEGHSTLPEELDVLDETERQELKDLLDTSKNSRNYFTVLFNDEVHTYDHVINTLVKIIKCSKMTASIMASTVSREGRSFILQDQYKPCKHVRDAIACVRDSGQDPLKVEVIHGSILAHQAFALKLVEWVRSMALLCDAFRVITAFTLFGSHGQHLGSRDLAYYTIPGHTLLDTIMAGNTLMWKMARVDWNELFVTTLLNDYSIKDKFARRMIHFYDALVRAFVDDDHDHSVSVLTMTTQLFTVPSLVCMLIEEKDALYRIVSAMFEIYAAIRNPEDLERRQLWDMLGLKRGFYIVSDFRHLISIEPTRWTDGLRANVIHGVELFLEFLSDMQGMDSVKRQIGQHIEYEPEWETGMTLQSRLINLITQLVKYCSLDEVVLRAILKSAQKLLIKDGGYKHITRSVFGHTAKCIQYDVSTMPVSVHQPLTRFAAALILELMRIQPCDKVPYDESLVILASRKPNESDCEDSTTGEEEHNDFKNSMIDIMEPALRTEVMIAQFRSGMWRRNGYSLVNQIIYFSGALMRKEMFDRDILLLQECAATCDADEFMIHLLNKFNLINWVTSETSRKPLVEPKAVSFHNDEEIMTQTMSLGEEFLQLILTITGERYRVGVGKVEEEDVIKHEIIQLLCIGPYTRSDIANKLYASDNEVDCAKSVANLKRSSESETGKYELKEEYYSRFNPFFYHYTRRHQSQALDAQLKRKRNAKEPIVCCPPPEPVELCHEFKNLNNVLLCDITLTIIQKVLRRAIGKTDSSLECSTKAPIRFMASDLQLDQCLHLVGLGLHEQARDPFGFAYVNEMSSREIPELLKECYEIAKRSTDLIFWLMMKTVDIIEKMESTPEYASDVERANRYSQIRQLFKPILSTGDSVKQESKKSNSEMAAKRRERIMAMMKAKQNKFMTSETTKQLAEETAKHEAPASQKQQRTASRNSFVVLRDIAAGASTSTLTPSSLRQEISSSSATTGVANDHQDVRMETEPPSTHESEPMDIVQDSDNNDKEANPRVVDPARQAALDERAKEFVGSSHLCILCRDEQAIAFDKPTMVLLAYVQRSSVLSKNRSERRIPNYSLTPSNQLKNLPLSMTLVKPLGSVPEKYSFTSDNSWSFDATFMPADLFFGPHISTCGHVMHFDCWKGFYDTITKRETSRPNRGARHVSFDLEKHEILCPLCECISNATIPLIPDYTTFMGRHDSGKRGNVMTVFNKDSTVIAQSAEHLTAFLHALKATVETYKHIRHLSQNPNTSNPQAIQTNHETGKYMRLLQPSPINDVLKDLDEREAFILRDFIASTRSERLVSNMCTSNMLNSIQTLADRIHSVGLDLDKSITDVHHARIFMMTSWSISYTIQASERALRFKGTPLFEDLESSKNLCLSSLIRFANTSMMIHQSDMIQSLLIQKLRYLLVGEEHLSSSPSCLDIDAFELFVSIFVMLQKLYSHIQDDTSTSPNSKAENSQTMALSDNHDDEDEDDDASMPINMTIGQTGGQSGGNEQQQKQQKQRQHSSYAWTTRALDHEYFRNLLHLMVILNLVQVSITIQNDATIRSKSRSDSAGEEESRPNEEDRESSLVQQFFKDITLASGHPGGNICKVDKQFISRIRRALLPFLRSCAIFFYQLSAILPKESLMSHTAFHEGKNFAASQDQEAQAAPDGSLEPTEEELKNSDMEFSDICEYLDLPTSLATLLGSKEARNLALTWLRHSRVLPLIKESLESAQKRLDEEAQQLEQRQPQGVSGGLTRISSSSSVGAAMKHENSSSELMPVKFIRQPHSVNRLIDLPHDYSELVDRVSNFTCPSIKNEDSRTPTMCLVCGVMLCSQSYCCQRDLNDLASNYQLVVRRQEENRANWLAANASGAADQGGQNSTAGGGGGGGGGQAPAPPTSTMAAFSALFTNMTSNALSGAMGGGPGGTTVRSAEDITRSALNSFTSLIYSSNISQQLVGSCAYHAHECSGGVGVFLRIRSCQVLLLSGRSKGCYRPAPYIDDHGATDFGLMRGSPLHLNKQLYERLQSIWMSHTIPEQISRTLEYSPHASNINWHLH